MVLGFASAGASLLLGAAFAACAVGYLVLNLLYSFHLKEAVILDVLCISLGFVLRAVAGAVAIGVLISEWLLVCTFLLALFLALAKRRHELASLTDDATGHRKIARRVQPLPARPDDLGGHRVVPDRLRLLHPGPGDGGEVPDPPPGLDHPLRAVRDLPLSLPRAPQGAGRVSPPDILLTDRPLLATVALWAAAIVLIVYTAGGAPMLGR